MDKTETGKIVRETYGKIAQSQESCGCGTCGPNAKDFAKSIGYSEGELALIPDKANLALVETTLTTIPDRILDIRL